MSGSRATTPIRRRVARLPLRSGSCCSGFICKAAGVGLSADYVARLFARRYGMTLQHYLLLRRVELARHLLVSSGLLVSEIGWQVGMPDPHYFNKQFRRVVGQGPLAFRRQQARRSRGRKSPGKFILPEAKTPRPRGRATLRPSRVHDRV
jgi:hypothetical protein